MAGSRKGEEEGDEKKKEEEEGGGGEVVVVDAKKEHRDWREELLELRPQRTAGRSWGPALP